MSIITVRRYESNDDTEALLLCDDCAWESAMAAPTDEARHPSVIHYFPHTYQWVADDQTDEQHCEECDMGRWDASRNRDKSELVYKFAMHLGRKTTYYAKIHVGPGDSGEPVITIMLPSED